MDQSNQVLPFCSAVKFFNAVKIPFIHLVTATLVYYFGYVKKKLSTNFLLGWNFLALGILIFTVINGILSAPTPFQKFAFAQPNIAVLYFPFTLLPGLVVPIVYFAHIITIRHLLRPDMKAERQKTAGRGWLFPG